MGRKLLLRASAAGALLSVIHPAFAQDTRDDGGIRQRLFIEQRIAGGRNLGLSIPEEGTTTAATTSILYGFKTETRTQSLSLLLGGAFRFGSIAAGNSLETGFTDPTIGLRYSRSAANSRFLFDVNAQESDISQSAPLWSFIDSDGVLEAPRDLADLTGSGNRRSYNASVELETGIEGPLGFKFTLSANGVDYINATSAALSDFDQIKAGVTTSLRFDPVTTGVVDLRYSQYDSANPLNTDRTSQTYEIGFDRSITPVSKLSLRMGYTESRTKTGVLAGGSSGVTGSVSYSKTLSDGSLTASLNLARSTSGETNTLRFGRQFELPTGRFGFNLGASSVNGNTPELIGGLNWSGAGKDSNVSLNLNRSVSVDSNDESRFSTTMLAHYDYTINAFSNLAADLSYTVLDRTTLSNGVRRSELELSYRRQLTEDWNLRTGLSYQVRDEDTVGKTDSQNLFVSLSRSFDF